MKSQLKRIHFRPEFKCLELERLEQITTHHNIVYIYLYSIAFTVALLKAVP